MESFEQAIAQSRLGRIKSLLGKVVREGMPDKARTKLLGNLYDMAAERTDKYIDSFALWGNWRDLAKLCLGSTCFVGGIAGLAASIALNNPNDPRTVEVCRYGKIASGIIIPLGAYLWYQGFTCSTQRTLIVQATEVEEYIDNVLNNAELLEDEAVKSS